MHILITGGAGFIGSHRADELLRCDHRVRALDPTPSYLDDDIELIRGDVRHPPVVRLDEARAQLAARGLTV